ncbi:DUF6527 family protein [Neoroseomonas lacus]|uniref:Uncharacterized protein n=1 Tax=Neoroseomonas lacus TaxID=287609 RepID=A0A917KJM4_9PROT|nr:DUF6527 family protein [Neoroseomonas lacus]GGJ14396.1 hypothetical protein GCM10011320_21990 [Neoroseomonas lacus]
MSPLVFHAGNPDEIERGEFAYRRRDDGSIKWVVFWPLDCGCPISIPIAPQRPANGATWAFSGTDAAPTLSPSVNAVGIWHGWLRDGVATQC